MFQIGLVYATNRVQEIIQENEINIDELIERHLKLEDDTNAIDRHVNEYAIEQGFGSIISIYNVASTRIYVHTVQELEGRVYTKIYTREEY